MKLLFKRNYSHSSKAAPVYLEKQNGISNVILIFEKLK